MRVYVSSTFEDLTEHRAAAIQILRQLGHDVVAMEDYAADTAVPLEKVLGDVEGCDIFISIVAFRYGYVPRKGPEVTGAKPGKTSITEFEYCKATETKKTETKKTETKKTVLAFLLDERAPWPPHYIDGVRNPKKGAAIGTFRAKLQREKLVAFFTTPDSLASRVAAAVGTVGIRREVQRQLLSPLSPDTLSVFMTTEYLSDSYTMPLIDLVAQPTPSLVVAIDLQTTWWSTRLYLLAAVGQELGDLRRIVFLEKDRFIGVASAAAVRSALRRIHKQADSFERRVLSQVPDSDVRKTASRYLERDWNQILGAQPNDSGPESQIQISVTVPNLRLWLGESFLETPIRIEDLETASAIDLLRILDYPNDFVPVISIKGTNRQSIRLADKRELSYRLAHNTVVEMLDRLGVR